MYLPISLSLLTNCGNLAGIRVVVVASDDPNVIRKARKTFNGRKSYLLSELMQYSSEFKFACIDYSGNKLLERIAYIQTDSIVSEPIGQNYEVQTVQVNDLGYNKFVCYAKYLCPSITADPVVCKCQSAIILLDTLDIKNKTLFMNSKALCFWTPRYTKISELNTLVFISTGDLLLHKKNKIVYVLERGNIRHTAYSLFEELRVSLTLNRVVYNSAYLENNTIIQEEKEFNTSSFAWSTVYKRTLMTIDGSKAGGVL